VTRGDRIVEEAAERVRGLSARAAGRGGVAARLAEPLAEDADFLRKLKPSLIGARVRGESAAEPTPVAHGDGSPLPLLGAALIAGVATAKLLDWRGHAHPRG
jgi:hypothetical protein